MSLLDLSSLEKAIGQLEDSIACNDMDMVKANPRLTLHMRAASIQAFEFTYELAWKMLKRYLSLTEPEPNEIEQLSFPDLIRLGCQRGLLRSDLNSWKNYRQERGTTSHTYDQDRALEIYEKLPDFLGEAKFLLSKLQERNK